MNSPLGDAPVPASGETEKLESWKEIAAYLGKGVTTVRRWEREEGLPVRRQEHIKRGSVVAYKHELDQWRRTRTTSLEVTTTRWSYSKFALWTAALAAVVIVTVSWSSRREWNPVVELLQLTAYPGPEESVSFAPGGQRFAYTSEGRVLLKEMGVEPPRELFRMPGEQICCLRWSPDGSRIAISHANSSFHWHVSLIDTEGRMVRALGPGGPAMAWLPDGKAVLFPRRTLDGTTAAIYEFNLDTSAIRQVSFPPSGSWGDIAVAVDETGRRMALARYSRFSRGDLFLADYGSREAVQITDLRNWIVEVDFLPHGQGIVFDGVVAGHSGLYRVAADGSGPPRMIQSTEGINRYARSVATGPNTIRIGFAHEYWDPNLVQLNRASGVATPVAVSTQSEESPDLSVDGRLAFVSARAGMENVWVCPPGCRELRQITKFRERQFELTPRWSPDGTHLVLTSLSGGRTQLTIMGASGEEPRILSEGTGEARPSWSSDGRHVYFQSDRGGRPEIWRIPASGEGSAVQVTRNGGIEAFESPGGQELYFIRSSESAILYRKHLAGGAETEVKGIPRVRLGNWRPVGNVIFYWTEAPRAAARLYEFNLSTGRNRLIPVQTAEQMIHGMSANPRGDIVWSERGPVLKDLQAVDLTFPAFWKRF